MSNTKYYNDSRLKNICHAFHTKVYIKKQIYYCIIFRLTIERTTDELQYIPKYHSLTQKKFE